MAQRRSSGSFDSFGSFEPATNVTNQPDESSHALLPLGAVVVAIFGSMTVTKRRILWRED